MKSPKYTFHQTILMRKVEENVRERIGEGYGKGEAELCVCRMGIDDHVRSEKRKNKIYLVKDCFQIFILYYDIFFKNFHIKKKVCNVTYAINKVLH